MAKSPNDQFRDVFTQLAVLTERDTARQQEVKDLRELVETEQRERVRLQVENAALKQRLDDHIKRAETWSGRLWALVVMLAAAALSLASGLIVALNKK